MIKSHFMHGLRYAMIMVVTFTFLPFLLNAQVKGTFKDGRDGNVYNWSKIGTQTWMTGNLKYDVPAASWAYNNDTANLMNFGRLYTWKAAQVACPKGWHLPSEKEWGVLIESQGGSGEAGLKIQAMDTIGKGAGMAGTATPYPMSSLLSGVRHPDGSVTGINIWGGCWTSGKVNDTVGSNVLFARGTKDLGISTNDKKTGFSVRCIRNK
jgi:uncharacterized protein (TIGR02145 family)